MEKKHQQEEYVDFVVTARKYKTLLTAKYKSRPMWHKPSAGDVVSHLPGTIIKIMVEEGQAVEAGLLPDMGEGAFTPGKRVTKVQVIRAWNRLKKLGLAK